MKKIIIILALLILVIAIGFFIKNKKDQALISGELPLVNESEIEGWNTYNSVQYGFEIKYPADWQFEEQDSATVGFFQTGTPKQFEGDEYHFPSIRFSAIKEQNIDYHLRSQMERKKYKLDSGIEIIKFIPTTKDSTLNSIVHIDDKIYLVNVTDNVFGQPSKDLSNRDVFDKMLPTIKPIR